MLKSSHSLGEPTYDFTNRALDVYRLIIIILEAKYIIFIILL